MRSTRKDAIIAGPVGRIKRFFELQSYKWVSTALIVISLIPVAGLPGEKIFNTIFLALFSVELLFRGIVYFRCDFHDPKLRRVEALFLTIDFVATLSFLPDTVIAIDVRFLRVFRLIRLFKLLRNFSGTFRDILTIVETRALGRQIRILVVTILMFNLAGALIKALTVPADGLNQPPGLSFDGVFEGFWWCMRQMADPGNMLSLTEVRNFQHGLLSISMMVVGVLILSFIIGIGAEIIRELIENTKNSPLEIEDHYILCGWSAQAEILVRNLYAYLRDNELHHAFRFAVLDPGDREREIIGAIHAPDNLDRDSDEQDADGIDYVAELKPGRRIFTRVGTALSSATLNMVNAAEARKIVILPEESRGIDPDPGVIATILNVRSQTEGRSDGRRARDHAAALQGVRGMGTRLDGPEIISVLQNPDNCDLALTAGADMAVSKSDFISKFLSQLMLNPWISEIFKELFSCEGSEIYTIDLKGARFTNLVGKAFDLRTLVVELIDRGIIFLGVVRRRLKTCGSPGSSSWSAGGVEFEKDMVFFNNLNYDRFFVLKAGDNDRFTPPAGESDSDCVVMEIVYLSVNGMPQVVAEALGRSTFDSIEARGGFAGEEMRLAKFLDKNYTGQESAVQTRTSPHDPANPASQAQARASEKASSPAGGPPSKEKPGTVKKKQVTVPRTWKVTIFGWNHGVPLLISNLNSFLKNLEVTVMVDDELDNTRRATYLGMICRASKKKNLDRLERMARKSKKGVVSLERLKDYLDDDSSCATGGRSDILGGLVDPMPSIRFVQGNYTCSIELITLTELDLSVQDYIILLPEYDDRENPDGKVFLGILNIMHLMGQGLFRLKNRARIIAEVTDVNQGALMDRIVAKFQQEKELASGLGSKAIQSDSNTGTEDFMDGIEFKTRDWLHIVPSENFFHRFLASILFDPQLKRIYDRLFTDKGEEIYILRPETSEAGIDSEDSSGPFDFLGVRYGAPFRDFYLGLLRHGVTAIGVIEGDTGKISINPGTQAKPYLVRPRDHFVVICSKDNPIKGSFGLQA